VTDWTQLARDVGSLQGTSESGGSKYACRAIEQLLGDERIREAVEHIVAGRPGSELAMNVLRHIESERAAQVAYEVYRASSGDRASMAVWLIKHIAHPSTVAWVPELLADPNVAGWGVGLLDQLLWCERVEPHEVEHLLIAAEQHAAESVREQAAFIRVYLRERAERVG
jgi:hypothetical protein